MKLKKKKAPGSHAAENSFLNTVAGLHQDLDLTLPLDDKNTNCILLQLPTNNRVPKKTEKIFFVICCSAHYLSHLLQSNDALEIYGLSHQAVY